MNQQKIQTFDEMFSSIDNFDAELDKEFDTAFEQKAKPVKKSRPMTEQAAAKLELKNEKLLKKKELAIARKKIEVGPEARKEDDPVIDKLGRNVRDKLDAYLKRNPKYNIIKNQYAILIAEAETYRRNKSTENYEKTMELADDLKTKLVDIRKVFRGSTSTESKKQSDTNRELINNSAEIKALNAERKELDLAISENSPSHISTKIRDLRKLILINEESVDRLSGDDEVMDFDDLLSSTSTFTDMKKLDNLNQDYYNLCGKVADLIDLTVDEVMNMSHSGIMKELHLVLDNSELIERRKEVSELLNYEKEKLSTTKTIVHFMHEMFEFKNLSEADTERAKELLALTSIPFVRGVAYKICLQNSALHKLDHAVSAGLFGLSQAINSWLMTQLANPDKPLLFTTYSMKWVKPLIQKSLYELTSGGNKSGSTAANNHHFNKKLMENFLKYNPEFKELNPDIVKSLLDGYLDDTITITSQSDLAIDDEGNQSEMWTNLAIEESDFGAIEEAKIEYERLINSIKMLLDLFEDYTDRTSSVFQKKKLFNKYERKLFMMYFGLEYKKDKIVGDNVNKINAYYTQEEMAAELSAMYRANGDIKNANYKQENLAGKKGKIAKLLQKIKIAIESNTELKMAFEYLYRYFQENNVQLEILSNAREEIDMKIERDELREIFSDNDVILNKQLSDGKKLSDLFEISDNNILNIDTVRKLNQYK